MKLALIVACCAGMSVEGSNTSYPVYVKNSSLTRKFEIDWKKIFEMLHKKAPVIAQMKVRTDGYKIKFIGEFDQVGYSLGKHLGAAKIDGACNRNNNWSINVSFGWNNKNGWTGPKPGGSAGDKNEGIFNTTKTFYWPDFSHSDINRPHFVMLHYHHDWNTISDYRTYYGAWDHVACSYQAKEIHTQLNRRVKEGGMDHFGPILIHGVPVAPGMAGTDTNYRRNKWVLGSFGDSCLEGVDLYEAIPQRATKTFSGEFEIATRGVREGDYVDVPILGSEGIELDPYNGVNVQKLVVEKYTENKCQPVEIPQDIAAKGEEAMQTYAENIGMQCSLVAAQNGWPSFRATEPAIIYSAGRAYLRVKLMLEGK